jgi:hypothetical protein
MIGVEFSLTLSLCACGTPDDFGWFGRRGDMKWTGFDEFASFAVKFGVVYERTGDTFKDDWT